MASKKDEIDGVLSVAQGIGDLFSANSTRDNKLESIGINREGTMNAFNHEEEALLLEFNNANRRVDNEAQKYSNYITSNFFRLGITQSSVRDQMYQKEADMVLEAKTQYQQAYDNNRQALQQQRETAMKKFDNEEKTADTGFWSSLWNGIVKIGGGILKGFSAFANPIGFITSLFSGDSDSDSGSSKKNNDDSGGGSSGTTRTPLPAIEQDNSLFRANRELTNRNFIQSGQTALDSLHNHIETSFGKDSALYNFINTNPYDFDGL